MKILLILILLIALLTVVFFLGPKVEVDTRYTVPQLPEDLDQWLQDSENQYSDITPGAEKTIIWADPDRRQQTDYAFVYLHGFSATRQETAPVSDLLAAKYKANLYYNRLRGHGRSDDAMAEASAGDWLNDAVEAMAIGRQLGRKIILVGCSTGATLAWWLSAQAEFKPDIAGLILIAPNFALADRNSSLLLLPWGKTIARAAVGEYRSFEPGNEAQAKYWTYRYPSSALVPMVALVKLAADLPPEQQQLPTFFAYSTLDDTVDAAVIADYYQRLQGPKQRLIIDDNPEDARHVILGDIMAPKNNETAVAEISSFLQASVLND